MRLFKIFGPFLAVLSLSVPATPATDLPVRPSSNVSAETVQSFVEGRNDAYRHVLSFANLRFRDQSVPGMPASEFYAFHGPEMRRPYVFGALFAFSHLASSFGRQDLVSCYNSFSRAGPEVLDQVYAQNSDIRSRNVIAILLNFCITTEALQVMVEQTTWR